ncbi:hypothetical protein ISR94_03585 [Candidatus Microgenomates bacterium]|nr:hypothetical protein [Candidatus Microgenomates bacterium]
MSTKDTKKVTSVVAKQSGGNIQITYTIPSELVTSTKAKVLEGLAKDMEIKGFRKGKAPVSKVEEQLDPNKLNEQILQTILPPAFADSVAEHKLNPAIYPKFEAIKIEPGKDWEMRAITCELPAIVLGDYKKKIEGELAASKIIVPGKKEQEKVTDEKLIKILLDTVKLDIPDILIEEEVNGRLSSLLARIEKLGLQLEGYLQTVGKTVVELRAEYKTQSEEAIKLELILNKIAQEEKIEVTESEIDSFIKTTGSDPTKVEKPQKDSLTRVIQRRKALEKLALL